MRISPFVALAVFGAAWLFWSGIFTPLLLAIGAICCVGVLLLARRTGFFDREVYTLHLGPRLPRYWRWLSIEIVKANLTVVKIVLSRHPRIQPTLVTVHASELSSVAQAILANSITLTPASVSLDVEDGRILVHCLTKESAEDVRRGEMLQRVAAVTGS